MDVTTATARWTLDTAHGSVTWAKYCAPIYICTHVPVLAVVVAGALIVGLSLTWCFFV